MKIIDRRLNSDGMKLLTSMKGGRFEKFEADPFNFTPSVYGIVGLYIGDKVYSITNFVEPADFFGKTEDVAVFRLNAAHESEIHSCMDGGELIAIPVENIIKDVFVVNEQQQLFYNGEQTYEVNLTRAVIFVLEDRAEISFEKDIWFSEEIIVRRGHKLLDKLSSCEDFTENWEGIEGYDARASREVIAVK